MIELRMSRQTAQALYTLMTYAVPSGSAYWHQISNLYTTMSDSEIFSDEEPYTEADFRGYSQIDYWKIPLPKQDTVTLTEDGL